jgi:predicted enzyme related to lactoylglutathione lyase
VGDIIVHVEIPVTDLNKAEEFYSSVFGWKINVMPQMNYALFETGSPPGGGFNQVDKVKEGGIIFYIGVDNIEEKLKEIENAGCKTVEKATEIPGFSARARLGSQVQRRVLQYLRLVHADENIIVMPMKSYGKLFCCTLLEVKSSKK